MLNKILSITLLVGNLYCQDWTIACKGDFTNHDIKSWKSTPNAPYITFGFDEPSSSGQLWGEMDTVNFFFYYWDDTSPACGGDGEANIELTGHCNDAIQSSCWDVKLGTSGVPLMEAGGDGYINGVIYVNGQPCMPRDTTSFTFGAYEWNDNYDLGLGYANLNYIKSEKTYPLTQEEIKQQKEVCSPPDPNAGIDYTPYLNQIITNTSKNPNIEAMNNRQIQQDNDLNTFIQSKSLDEMMSIDDDLNSFNTTFETTLSNTYSSYSDIFGFGGYGLAPESIGFTMFEKEYKIFNPEVLTPYIDTIRNTFALFAYLWGFIIVFRNI